MKILELTNFSAGICGVWQRVKQESLELSRKHQVRVFSSNFTKGSSEIASSEESIGKVKISRFPAKKLGGESFMSWDFEQQALTYEPDIIIAHSYRHSHTKKALRVAEKIRKKGRACKVFLVTHAPFVDRNVRGAMNNFIVKLYDFFIGKRVLSKFDKVIAITKWEIPFLLNLGVREEKIVYIPNGLPSEFFSKIKSGKSIFFLGRISPVKNLEALIRAVKEKKLDIIGPAEEEYKKHLLEIISKENIKNINFLPAVFDLKKKIDLIDKHDIFVLPSLTESMPQSLIEALARGKICISSKTRGGTELINDKENGFLFEDLSEVLDKIDKMSEKEKSAIRLNARKSAEEFKWSSLISRLESLF